MADTVSTIGGGGADYPDVAAWEADADVSAGRWIGEINTSTEMLNDDLTVNGITGSPTKDAFVWLRAAPGFQHAGVWDATKARIREDNGGHAIEAYEPFTTITGVQVEQSNTGNSLEGIRVYENDQLADDQLIHNVIVRCTGAGGGNDRDCIYMPNPPSISGPVTAVHISNTVCYGHDRAGINMQAYTAGNNRVADIQVLHCSIGDAGPGDDADLSSGGVVRYHRAGTMQIDVNCENVLVVANGTSNARGFQETNSASSFDPGGGDYTGNNNISDDASADDVETFTSSYANVAFVTTAPTSGENAWLEDPTAADPDLRVAGENSFTVTQNGAASTATATQTTDGTTLVQDLSTDIAGNPRKATPTIGAFEYPGTDRVYRIGDVYTVQFNNDLAIAVDVPHDADACLVEVSGNAGGTSPVSPIDDLSWDNGGSVDFTSIIQQAWSTTQYWQVGAYIMTAADANWPGSGAQTLNVEMTGYVEGLNCVVTFLKNVDQSSPVVDTEGRKGDGESGQFVSSLTGVGANDLSRMTWYEYQNGTIATPDFTNDQTTVALLSQYFNASLGVVEKIGESAMRGPPSSIDSDFVHIAYAIAYAAPGGGTTLDTEAGAWSSAGLNADLDKTLATESGAWTYSGALSLLARALQTDPGLWTVAGALTSLTRALQTNPAAWTLSGQDAQLDTGLLLTTEAGTWTLAGQDATILAGITLDTEPGAWTVTGLDAPFLRALATDPAAWTWAGQDSELITGVVLVTEAGTWTLTGADGLLVKNLDTSPGAWNLSGQDTALFTGIIMQTEPGVWSMLGQLSDLPRDFDTQAGGWALAGQDSAVVIPGEYYLEEAIAMAAEIIFALRANTTLTLDAGGPNEVTDLRAIRQSRSYDPAVGERFLQSDETEFLIEKETPRDSNGDPIAGVTLERGMTLTDETNSEVFEIRRVQYDRAGITRIGVVVRP